MKTAGPRITRGTGLVPYTDGFIVPFVPLQSGQSEYRRVIDALERGGFGPGKANGKETRFRCPVHGDHTPSLDVAEGRDGKALLTCRSVGCPGESVLKALNIAHANGHASRNGTASKPPAPRERAEHYSANVQRHPQAVPHLASKLSIPESAVRRIDLLGCDVWDELLVWTWPERDGRGNIIGVSYRTSNGDKKSFAGSKRGLVLPVDWEQVISGPLFVSEGLSDLLALLAAGFAAVARPMKCATILEMLSNAIGRTDHRHVVILADRDDCGDGSKAADLAGQLAARFPERSIQWAGPPDDAKDAREWLTSRDYDWQDRGRDFLAALETVDAPMVIGRRELKPIEADDDPHRLARLYIDERCQHADGLTLRFWRDEWQRWDGSAYRVVPQKELRAELTASAKAEMDRLNIIAQQMPSEDEPPSVRKITARMVADNEHALASLTVLPSRTEAPAWIEGNAPFPAAEILACRNGLIHLPSLVAEKDHFITSTPRFFSPNCLNFDFNASAPRPMEWRGFLNLLWPDDPQNIQTLQEWIGYLLTPDTRQQKILMIVGPKRSGKGTIARVIRELLGSDNVAGPTLSSLGTNFGLWPLLGKTAAIVSDARLSGRTDSAAVTERLLSISGEDALTIDRKNLAPVTVKLPARFMILTNELPRLGDSSGALTGRMILLRMTQSWFGKEDTTLTDRLLTELSGILLWAIEGWKRLHDRGYFLQPDDGLEMLSELDVASPIGAFVRERCNVGPGERSTVADLFAAWKLWCESKGRREPGTEATFGSGLLAAIPTLRRVRPRDGEDRYRAYEGIGLR